uniref:Uncharacterized protein n=1 Tax=Aegilops tauschii subsp. strangulata TaxID=200361 RepID=A0A453GP61_AEGTS
MLGKWSVGLCDCFGDSGTCCLTCWCPCITFGRIAEVVDGGSSSCCMHGTLCALCQEYKELENRGFNMSKGIS